MKKILVTGSGGSASTNFIRSLRLAPEKFYIVGADSSKYYIHLSHADKNYLIPQCHDKEYINSLNKIIEDEKIDFVHCQPDPEVLELSMKKGAINTLMFLPEYKDVMACQDKFVLNKLLHRGHCSVPVAWASIDECPFSGKKYWLRSKTGAGSLAALPVTNKEQAFMWIKYWETRGLKEEDFMISEYLPGKEFAWQSLWKDGELITSACRQRLEYLFQNRMPSGQSSTPTVAMSVHNDFVNTVCYDALVTVNPYATGVFCVDLKMDDFDVPRITEINAGRFFTTSLFFSTLGANMPYLYIKLGLGEHIERQLKYNAVPENMYWIRQIDCGEQMVKLEDLEGGKP